MNILFIEPRVKNPVRISLALPMTFLYLSSFIKKYNPNITLKYHSFEIDNILGIDSNIDSIYSSFLPQVVMSSTITTNFNSSLKILSDFKSKYNCITVLGGVFASANDEYILNNFSTIDYIVRGEGEATLSELLNRISSNKPASNINGLSTRYRGTFIKNPLGPLLDLHTLPQLNHDGLNVEVYKSHLSRFYVFASRGCNYNCSFCTLSPHWQYCQRYFKTERVVSEIETIIRIYHPEKISFGDDTLSLNDENMVKTIELLQQKKLPVKFGAKTRADVLTEKHLKSLAIAGFNEISIGIESNIETQLNEFNKQVSIDDINRIDHILPVANALGFRINMNFILGTPGETNQSLENKIIFITRLCRSKMTIPLLSFLTPHPGSELYSNIRDLGLIMATDDFNEYNHLTPVCYPESLGDNGINLLKTAYNKISKATNSEIYNPLLEP